MYFEEEDNKLKGLSRFGKLVIAVAGLIAGFIISRIFIFMPFIVQDDSMKPGLEKGDYVIILKPAKEKPGDVILLNSPVETDKVILKRLLTEGERTVEIKEKKIYIDSMEFFPKWNTLSKDSRVFPEYFDHRDNLPLIKIKQGDVFVIGDNLDRSFDSRTFGAVNKKLIIGKVIYKF